MIELLEIRLFKRKLPDIYRKLDMIDRIQCKANVKNLKTTYKYRNGKDDSN